MWAGTTVVRRGIDSCSEKGGPHKGNPSIKALSRNIEFAVVNLVAVLFNSICGDSVWFAWLTVSRL